MIGQPVVPARSWPKRASELVFPEEELLGRSERTKASSPRCRFAQLLLDRLLPRPQPVQSVVELILGEVGDLQLLGQGGVVPRSGVGQL